MTIQTKRYIELSDVISIRFTCNHCSAALSLAASDQKLTQGKDAQQNYFLRTCPSCGKYWAEHEGVNYEPTVKAFTAAFEQLRKAFYDQHSVRPGFSLALEITPAANRAEEDVP
jgi:primosomal protein N'